MILSQPLQESEQGLGLSLQVRSNGEGNQQKEGSSGMVGKVGAMGVNTSSALVKFATGSSEFCRGLF